MAWPPIAVSEAYDRQRRPHGPFVRSKLVPTTLIAWQGSPDFTIATTTHHHHHHPPSTAATTHCHDHRHRWHVAPPPPPPSLPPAGRRRRRHYQPIPSHPSIPVSCRARSDARRVWPVCSRPSSSAISTPHFTPPPNGATEPIRVPNDPIVHFITCTLVFTD